MNLFLNLSNFTRGNLDPCSEKSDTDLWRALEIAQLKSTLQNDGYSLGNVKCFQ